MALLPWDEFPAEFSASPIGKTTRLMIENVSNMQNGTDLLYRHGNYDGARALHAIGERKVRFCSCFSDTILNGKICEADIAIKQFE